MKKIKIIKNPSSGKKGYESEFYTMCNMLLEKSYMIHLFNTKKKYDAYHEAKNTANDYDIIIVSGGDGTVNEVAKGIYEAKSKTPMAIFMSGTVNDFAKYLKLPANPKKFVDMIEKNKIINIDLGSVNGEIFINVAAAGAFVSIAHSTTKEKKKYLGRGAYYLDGMTSLNKNMKTSYKLRLEVDNEIFEEEFQLFLISNSKSAGGFSNISPRAEIQDGYLDCIFLRKGYFFDQAEVFMKIFKGTHLESEYIKYFKCKKIKIDLLDNKELEMDIDGEKYGEFPVEVNVIENAINIIVEE